MKKRLTKIAQVTVAMLRENRGLIACLIGEIRSGLSGECSDLRGDCSGLWGDCSGLSGDCSGLSGDIDACEITDDERENRVKITDLISE